jgi:hypothetical protein
MDRRFQGASTVEKMKFVGWVEGETSWVILADSPDIYTGVKVADHSCAYRCRCPVAGWHAKDSTFYFLFYFISQNKGQLGNAQSCDINFVDERVVDRK